MNKKYILSTLLIGVIILIALVVAFCYRQATAITPANRETNENITLSFVGDIMLSRGLSSQLETKGYEYPYEEVRDLFLEDDCTIANLECPITSCNSPVNKPGIFIFRAAPDNAKALKNSGFDCFVLANNHSMDQAYQGLSDTIDHIKENGMDLVGAGKTAAEIEPFILEKNGFRIGIMAYTALPPEGYYHLENRPSLSYINQMDYERIGEEIKAFQCDYKIVYFHWGEEYNFYHNDIQTLYAHMAIECGADFVVGSHPHVLQDTEEYQGKSIVYSLGNFVFDKQIPPGTDETCILQLTIQPDGKSEYTIIPANIRQGKVFLSKEKAHEMNLNNASLQ